MLDLSTISKIVTVQFVGLSAVCSKQLSSLNFYAFPQAVSRWFVSLDLHHCLYIVITVISFSIPVIGSVTK
jgi:hypothetical protein